MTLYDLKEEYMQLFEMAEDETLDPQIIADTLESIDAEFEEKADACATVMRTWDGQISLLDNEIKRLQAKKQTFENNKKSLKASLENIMNLTGKRKFKTLLFSFGIQKNPPSLVIDDVNAVPEEFIVVKKEIDETTLKKYLKENEVAFAHLQQGESLRIR